MKLGPRPSLDVGTVGGRPHTSGAASYYRPVSTLPAGLKLFSRGSKKEKERSKHPGDPPTMTISPPPMPDSTLLPSQDVHTRPHTSGGRPNTSSEPLMSPSLSSPTSAANPKLPIITPEKARLMKALQLRNKKKQEAINTPEPTPPAATDALVSPTSKIDRMSTGAPKEVEDTLAALDELVKADDSGIAFDATSTLKTDESDATRCDSYPVSPVGPSEKAESTRASSISESTDETVQEPKDPKQPVQVETLVDDETEQASPDHEETTPISNDSIVSKGAQPAPEHLERLSPTTYNPLQTSKEAAEAKSLKVEAPGTVEGKTYDGILPVSKSEALQPEEVDLASGRPGIEVSAPVASLRVPLSTPDQDADPELGPDMEDEPVSPSRLMRVPTSKFNVQDQIENVSETPILINRAQITPPEKSPVGSTFSTADESHNSKKQRRKGLVEPIRTDISSANRSLANSEANFSSDDELMDELSSAVVQEAQPISVSKSPVSPVFPSPKKRHGEQSRLSRVFSTPLRKEKSDASMLEPPSGERPPSRSVSAGAAYLNRISQQPSKPLAAKKVNLGSGISQRIKALEKLSSLAPGAGTPTGTTGPTQGASTAFFSVRKGSVRGKSPSIA